MTFGAFSRLFTFLPALCRASGADAAHNSNWHPVDDQMSLLQHSSRRRLGSGMKVSHGMTGLRVAVRVKQSPYDPPGAPCINCDEHGNYRMPGRANCTVNGAERAMVQNAKERLTKDPYDYALVNNVMSFVMMALVCTDYLDEQGGFDLIFSVLRNADDLPGSPARRAWFEMNGWMALSDQSMSPQGSQIIGNYGGPGKGIGGALGGAGGRGETHA